MYYVYQLIDPRNGEPFYVGKGKGRRAKTHLWKIPETRNEYKENKIASIRALGLEPEIKYVIENIESEVLAYNLETEMIKFYGRKGYEKDGILTNVCLEAKPPNHQGKTYEEIYGSERADAEKQKRANSNKGKKRTPEQIQNIKDSLKNRKPTYGRKVSDQSRRKMSESAFERAKYGSDNPLSGHYKLISPSNIEYELWGSELKYFCIEQDLSLSTLKKQIQKNNPWGIPKKGKTKGWKLIKL